MPISSISKHMLQDFYSSMSPVNETWTEQVEEQPTVLSVVRAQETAALLIMLLQCTSVSKLDKTRRN